MRKAAWKLFKVSRPVSWVNTAYPFAAGYLVFLGKVDPLLVIGTLFFLIPYNLLMYGINDVFDYESDLRNPRKGGLEGALEVKRFHPTILISCAVATIPFVILFAVWLPWPAMFVLLGVLFFVVAYSIKGLRFKEIPLLDSITSSLHFVGPLAVAWALAGFPIETWPYLIAFFAWGMASHAFGAVQDIIPDRKAGLHSIATAFGARFTTWFSFLLYLFAALLVALQGDWAILVGIAGLIYPVIIFRYLRVTDATSAVTNQGWRRFMAANYIVGAIVTVCLILSLT